jgi:hypothetical protein
LKKLRPPSRLRSIFNPILKGIEMSFLSFSRRDFLRLSSIAGIGALVPACPAMISNRIPLRSFAGIEVGEDH